jgi:hypothetical protein
MPLLRAFYSLIILALVLGTYLAVPKAATSHEMPDMVVSAVEHSVPADHDSCDNDATMPMRCAKVFCAGAAVIINQLPEASPEAIAFRFGPAPNQDGSGVSRLLDPDPPRTTSIG